MDKGIKRIKTINYHRASGGDRALEILDVALIVVNPSIAGVQVDVGIGVDIGFAFLILFHHRACRPPKIETNEKTR